jgi:hypothetical protein
MNCLAQTHDVADLHGCLFMRHCHHLVSAARTSITVQQTNADDNPTTLIIIKITRLQLKGLTHTRLSNHACRHSIRLAIDAIFMRIAWCSYRACTKTRCLNKKTVQLKHLSKFNAKPSHGSRNLTKHTLPNVLRFRAYLMHSSMHTRESLTHIAHM